MGKRFDVEEGDASNLLPKTSFGGWGAGRRDGGKSKRGEKVGGEKDRG